MLCLRKEENLEIYVLGLTKELIEGMECPGAAAVDITFADGSRDMIVYLPSKDATARLDNGLAVSGKLSLLRLDKEGKVIEARIISGNFMGYQGKTLIKTSKPDFVGKVEAIEGDISGNRRDSSLVVKPNGERGDLTGLAGRTVSVFYNGGTRVENYVVDVAETLDAGDNVRLKLRGAPPFADLWGEVLSLSDSKGGAKIPNAPNEFTGTSTTKGGSFMTSYLTGSTIAFPKQSLFLTIKGGEFISYTACRYDIKEDVSLPAAGVLPGDPFVIFPDYAGARVSIPMECGFMFNHKGERVDFGNIKNLERKEE